jgi:hypothetical protein
MGPSDTSVAKIYLQIEAEDELRDLRKTFQGLANDADDARAAIARALEGLKQKYGVNIDFDFNAKDLRDETTRFLAAS